MSVIRVLLGLVKQQILLKNNVRDFVVHQTVCIIPRVHNIREREGECRTLYRRCTNTLRKVYSVNYRLRPVSILTW